MEMTAVLGHAYAATGQKGMREKRSTD